jgi:hypothetical protein
MVVFINSTSRWSPALPSWRDQPNTRTHATGRPSDAPVPTVRPWPPSAYSASIFRSFRGHNDSAHPNRRLQETHRRCGPADRNCIKPGQGQSTTRPPCRGLCFVCRYWLNGCVQEAAAQSLMGSPSNLEGAWPVCTARPYVCTTCHVEQTLSSGVRVPDRAPLRAVGGRKRARATDPWSK